MRQQQDRFGPVTNDAVGQARLVILDERHDVDARDVTGIDDGEAGGIEVETEARDPAAGDGRSDGPGIELARPPKIIDVPGGAR